MCNKTDNMVNEILNTRDNFIKGNVSCKVITRDNGSIQSIVLDDLVKIPSKDLTEVNITYSVLKKKTLIELGEKITYTELEELNEALRSYDMLALDRLYRDVKNGRYSDVTKIETFLLGGIDMCDVVLSNLSEDDQAYLTHLCECYMSAENGIIDRVESIMNVLK
ncbi:hypothetical protein UT300012_21270 [Paraclostridium bifermentans]